MNCHINPKYVNELMNGGDRIHLVNGAEWAGEGLHAFMAYSVALDNIVYLAKDGRIWCSPVTEKNTNPEGWICPDIISIKELERFGCELLPDLWMVRNDKPSPFCFERKIDSVNDVMKSCLRIAEKEAIKFSESVKDA